MRWFLSAFAWWLMMSVHVPLSSSASLCGHVCWGLASICDWVGGLCLCRDSSSSETCGFSEALPEASSNLVLPSPAVSLCPHAQGLSAEFGLASHAPLREPLFSWLREPAAWLTVVPGHSTGHSVPGRSTPVCSPLLAPASSWLPRPGFGVTLRLHLQWPPLFPGLLMSSKC